MTGLVDIAGRKFGRLTALAPAGRRDKSGVAYWLARCDCGNEIMVLGASLRRGDTRSCGCLRSERTRAINVAEPRGWAARVLA